MVERHALNVVVVGSIPTMGTTGNMSKPRRRTGLWWIGSHRTDETGYILIRMPLSPVVKATGC